MDFQKQRQNMVQKQIWARGVQDPAVLQAMNHVPRHEFVQEEDQSSAYGDYPLPIPEGQTISQPYMVAYMSERLSLTKQDRVLEVGTGSGYQTAVLAELCREVYTLEYFPSLAQSAQERLQRLGYPGIHFRVGDGALGWPEAAPFAGILIAAACPRIPEALLAQLSIGGKMLLPLGVWDQVLVEIRRDTPHHFTHTRLMGVRFVPLLG